MTTNEIEPKKEHAVAQRLDYGEAGNAGWDSTQGKDFSAPQLWVLQDTHPQTKKNSAAYVEDAVPGMLYLPGQKRLIDPEIGLVYVFVRKAERYVEQVPFDPKSSEIRFRGIHALDSRVIADATARAKQDPKQATQRYPDLFTPEGHELIRTDYLFGYMLEKPDDVEPSAMVVIPIQGIKFEAARGMFDALNGIKMRKGKIPTFAVRFRLGTKFRRATGGGSDKWNLEFRPLDATKGASFDSGLIPPKTPDGAMHPLIAFGVAMNEAVVGGQVSVDTAQSDGATHASETPTATAGF